MPPKIDLSLRESVLTLYSLPHSSWKIVNILSDREMVISQSTVIRIIKEEELEDSGVVKSPPDHSACGKEKRRFPALINKVKKDISGANPMAQNQLSVKYEVSQRTIERIIHQDLQGELRKKSRVHAVFDAMIVQRMEKGSQFLEWINGRKWEKYSNNG